MNKSKISFGIVAKPSHRDALHLVNQLIKHLRSKSLEYTLDSQTAVALELDIAEESLAPREKLTEQCTHVVVLGGDGTLISVSRHPADRPPIIIGVNLGTLGFLTEITADEMIEVVDRSIDGSCRVEARSLLEVTVHKSKDKKDFYTAMNDIVISKDSLARIFPVEMRVNQEFAAMLRGDGVIVATPGGSTAYSLAAGGSIVHPGVQAMLVTPICPHSLTSRPLVLPSESEISLQISADSEAFSVFLTLDGQQGEPLSCSDRVSITTSSNKLYFAKSPSKNYYDVLGTKLKWANI